MPPRVRQYWHVTRLPTSGGGWKTSPGRGSGSAVVCKHLVTDYLPGQCCYNLGEYPCRKPWDPDDWDERELDRLRGHGIRLIQVHEEWNDTLRLFGSHKLDALNPAGFRRFADMVHGRGMRLIVYVSSGYFSRHDPDFRPEWAGPEQRDLRRSTFAMPTARR